MGLLWTHQSRYYITAWENGPYLVYERHWWAPKKIAQFDSSLQMAIWYVQDLDPNSTVAIQWVPRHLTDRLPLRPAPAASAPTSVSGHLRAAPHFRGVATVTTPPRTHFEKNYLDNTGPLIRLAKDKKPKYEIR